jgi:hypothetical protein
MHDATGSGDRDVPWTQEERYYFAYGSNMNERQLQSRGVKPLAVAVAKLSDHRISFHGYSKTWDGAIETVIAEPGSEVWGVIYTLRFSDAERLDYWQDVRLDGTGAYFLFPAVVTDTKGTQHHVLLYKKDILESAEKPSREYLEFIAQGAFDRGLPAHYIEELRGMDSKKAAYEVPMPSKLDGPVLAGSSCSSCGE